MPRIISLIASATEIVCALGLEDDLVGRSHECDYPPSVTALPQCTEPKIDVRGASADIDKRVKDAVRDGLSVYRVHSDILQDLKPDIIVTQDQCEVCAVSLADVENAVCELIDSNPAIVSLKPDCLADIWNDMRAVAHAADAQDRGETVIGALQKRMADIWTRAATVSDKPSVACIEWADPLMAAGNWVPELVEMAGGVNAVGVPAKHSPWMEWGALVERDPEVLVAMPCGFDRERTKEDMNLLAAKPEWQTLTAVQTGRVYVTDGNQYFNRPGPRVVESLEILAEILHPDVFSFGHEESGWERWA